MTTESTTGDRSGRVRRLIREWRGRGAVFAFVLVGFGLIGYFGVGYLTRSSEEIAAETRQLVPVRRGDLVDSVTTSGTVSFPERKTLSFSISGTIAEVSVSEGQTVRKDARLASFGEATLAALSLEVAKAESDLNKSRKALKDLSVDPLDIAQARSDLETAKIEFQESRDALKKLLETPVVEAFDIAQDEARSDLVDAEIQVQEARESLENLSRVDEADRVAADLAISEAELAIQKARDDLEKLSAPPKEFDVLLAQQAVEIAREQHAHAQADLASAEKSEAKKVSDAAKSFKDREKDYSTTFQGWLGTTLSADELAMAPADVLSSWDADLDAIFTTPAGFDFRLGPLAPVDDPDTRWDESLVFVWNVLSFYRVVGTCEDGAPSASSNTRCVMDTLKKSWDALSDARKALETAEANATKAVTSGRSAVDTAERALDDAVDAVSKLQETASLEEIRVAEDSLRKAEEDLATAQESKETLGVPKEIELSKANAVVQRAELNVSKVQKALADLLKKESEGLDETKVSKAEAAVSSGELNVEKAQKALDDMVAKEDEDAVEVLLAEANIREADARLAKAKANMGKGTIRAPFAGVLTSVKAEEGDTVEAGAEMFEIVDETVVDILAEVDEIDVLKLSVGAEASISLDALSGRELVGIIKKIGDSKRNQGVVSYPITIRVEPPEDVRLRGGLSATAEVTIGRQDDVLLIPSQAVGGSFTRPTVEVVEGDLTRTAPVELGSSNDFWVVVESGVSEGDVVVMKVVAQQSSFFGGPGGAGFTAVEVVEVEP